jgi:outer membrane protein assembly factor BamB
MILPLGVNAFMFRNDTAHSGVYNDGGTHPSNVKLWNYSFGGYEFNVMDNSTYASPTVVNGVVYVGSLGNDFAALYANNGTPLWTYQTDGDIHSSAAVVNNVVYFTNYGNKLYALNAATGSLIFTANIGAPGHSSPAVAEGYVYVGSDNGRVYAFDAVTGAAKPGWNGQTNTTPTATNTMHSSPAVVDNIVYIGNENGKVYALFTDNGTEYWNRTLGDTIYASPSVVDGIVYVGSTPSVGSTNPGNLSALSATTGAPVWAEPFYTFGYGIHSGTAVADGVVYFGDDRGVLWAVNAYTGAQNWYYETGANIYSSPAVANDRLYFGSYDGKVYCLDVNGTKIWDYSLGSFQTNYGIYSSPEVANGVVYIGAGEGNTNVFAIGNQTPLVQAPVAAFTSDVRNGTAPLTVRFTDQSTNTPTSWAWDFNNDGVVDNTNQNPSHTYPNAGLFTVNLTVRNGAGSDSEIKVNYINATAAPVSGTTSVGVFRSSTRQFIFNTSPVTRATFGLPTDTPIIGDWNNDGITDVGVFRPSTRQFIFNTAPVTRVTFGLPTDTPITGIWA